MVDAENTWKRLIKKDASNRYLVPEDSDRLPEKRVNKTDAARLYHFPAIMGQQALCQAPRRPYKIKFSNIINNLEPNQRLKQNGDEAEYK